MSSDLASYTSSRVAIPIVARRGFTLLETVLVIAIFSAVIAVAYALVGNFTMAADAAVGRAGHATAKEAFDARAREIATVSPALGDLSWAGTTAFSFRKRMAPSALVCSYAPPVVQLRMTLSELGTVQAGDSVAVRDSRGTVDPSDDVWDIAAVTSAVRSGTCVTGEPTIAVTLPTAPAAGSIQPGATVRLWSTRSYTVETAPSKEGGYVLTERINGGNASRIYGPFANTNVFTYYDASFAPAPSPAAVATVRATFTPYGTLNRNLDGLRSEVLDWPTAAAGNAVTAGDIVVPTAVGTVAARCTTPGASNFGDLKNACTFPAPTVTPTASPTSALIGQSITLSANGNGNGSFIIAYAWTGAASGSTAQITVLCSTPGSFTAYAQAENNHGTWSTAAPVSYSCTSTPVAMASITPAPAQERTAVTFSGTQSYSPGGSIVSYNWIINGTQYLGGQYGSVSMMPMTYGAVPWQLQVQDRWGHWSSWITGSLVVTMKPCPYNASISAYSAQCQPPCPYPGAPAGMTASDPACNNTPNAIAWDTPNQFGIRDNQGSGVYVSCNANGFLITCNVSTQPGVAIEGSADATITVSGDAAKAGGQITEYWTSFSYHRTVTLADPFYWEAYTMEPTPTGYDYGYFQVSTTGTNPGQINIKATTFSSLVTIYAGPTDGILRFHPVKVW